MRYVTAMFARMSLINRIENFCRGSGIPKRYQGISARSREPHSLEQHGANHCFFTQITVIGTEFLAHREKTEVTRHESTCEFSTVPVAQAYHPDTRVFCGHPRRMLQT
jgi:hypothetical protein